MSLKSLAKELGVSIATVSYALNHKGNISAELRARILEAAKAQGYELSSVAQALRGKRLKILGLMISSVYDEMGQRFFTGADRAAQEAGYSTILSVNSPQVGSALEAEIATVRRFQSLQISGVLYVPSANSEPSRVERALEEAGLRFSLLYRRTSSDPFPAVVVDHAEGFRLAFDHLQSLGHERIGFGYPQSYRGPEVDIARKVFAKKCRGRIWKDWSAPVDGPEFTQLLRQKPTALVASSDDAAQSIADRLEEAGLRIPQDISLVGFRDSQVARQMRPRLTTIHVPVEEMGYAAAKRLLAQIEGSPAATDSATPPVLQMKPHLVVRESTAPPAGKKR